MLEASFFPSATASLPAGDITIKDVLESIKNGKYKNKIEHLRKMRSEFGDGMYASAKKRIPAVTFAAKFNGERGIKTPFVHTGIVLADIDHLNGKKEELRAKLSSDSHTAFVFESPSSDGLKVGFRFNGCIEDDETHKRCWGKIEQYFKENYSVDIDPTGKDVSRLCFLSYDPNLYANRSSDLFEIPPPENTETPQVERKDAPFVSPFADRSDLSYVESVANRALETAHKNIVGSQPGEQHHTRLRMSRLVGGYVGGGMLDGDIAHAKLEDAVKWSGAKDMKAAMKTVKDGIQYGIACPITREQILSEKESFSMERYLKRVSDYVGDDAHPDKKAENKNEVVSPVTNVTNVTKDEKARDTPFDRDGLFSLLYKRYAHVRARIKGIDDPRKIDQEIPDSLSPEDILAEVKTEDFQKHLDNTEKKEFDFLCHNCHSLSQPCHNSVTTLSQLSQPSEKTQQRGDGIKGAVLLWVQESFGWFSLREAYEAMGAKNPTQKASVRKAVNRLCTEDVVEKHRTKNGTYRKIDNECEDIDFMGACDDSIDIWLPFGIHSMSRMLPGNIIVLAGSPNAGKTALLLNIIRYNLVKNWTVHYYNSEMGADELRMRLALFNDMTLDDWGRYRDEGKFRPKARSHDFQDVIIPGEGNLNVIDFLEMHDNFWEIGGVMRDIHDRLNGAIAVVALQKPRGRDTAKGGDITLEKPRLYISIEGGKAKIVKMKSFQGTENPNGKQVDFKLVNGSEIIVTKHWYYPTR